MYDRQDQFKKTFGLPVKNPAIEKIKVGTGGGLIASLDNIKRLCIGNSIGFINLTFDNEMSCNWVANVKFSPLVFGDGVRRTQF